MKRNDLQTDPVPTLPPNASRPAAARLVIFGMRCHFTRTVADECIQRGLGVTALLIEGSPAADIPPPPSQTAPLLPMAQPLTAARVPTYVIGSPGSERTKRLVTALAPDVIAVACYPTRIPQSTAAIARLAALNVHPSKLPAGRGPDPIFWTLQRGDGRASVTVHGLASRLDAGPIYAQTTIDYADGTTEDELDLALAAAGGRLLVETVDALRAGRAVAHPQDERAATYEPFPGDEDFVVDTARPARAAFNFIRGVAGRRRPVTIETPDGPIAVDAALKHSFRPDAETANESGERWVRFAEGWLLVRMRADGILGGR